jgi:hypothetical protein
VLSVYGGPERRITDSRSSVAASILDSRSTRLRSSPKSLASRQIGVTISIDSVGVPGLSRRQAAAISAAE